jgi:hypothetical protein
MYKSFEPGYGYGVADAISSSIELRTALVSPERNTPDSDTVVALSVDLSRNAQKRLGFIPQYEIGQAKFVGGESDNTAVKRFGDAITHELLVSDLLEASHAKPFVADFDTEKILRGIVLALDRENDSRFETLWDSVGINYSTVFIAGYRPGDAEAKAISFIRGLNQDTASLQSPWLLRVGAASAVDTRTVKSKMQMRTHKSATIDSFNDETRKVTPKSEAVFTDGDRYKMFIGHIQRGVLDQSTGKTLENFSHETASLDPKMLYFDTINRHHKFDSSLLLTPVSQEDTDELNERRADKVLFVDELTGYEGRLVAGKFLVQTVTAFIPGAQWLKISEIEAEQAEDVRNIIKDEIDAQARLVRKRSIF